MPELEATDVLIIGAGPAGLALAIELGQRGVRCTVLEQNERVGLNPRAKTTNIRTREHLRRWGIAENLRRASKLPPDFPSNVVFATRMSGHLLARIPDAMNCSPERNDLYSESGQWIPQYILEEVMRAHAVTLPTVDIRFDTTYVSAEQNSEGVTTTARNTRTGELETYKSAYLVGADGARSVVRETIKATMEGKRGIAQNVNIQFHAPALAGMHPHGPAIMYWMINSEVPAVLGPMEGEDHWYLALPRVEGTIGDIDLENLVRKATGLEFEFEIQGSSPWVAHSLIADRYSDARIFLAGDACHLHPPFGGYGMNMGIADGVDLGWKLAAVIQGWAAPELLATYEIERRPIHIQVIQEAVANYNALGNHLTIPGLETPGPVGDATRREAGEVIFAAKLREFKSLGVILGYRYADSPIVVPDGTEPPAQQAMIYRPSAYPGCLAPHLWLEDGTSLYDHFGLGFTLLATTEAGAAALEAAAATAAGTGFPLKAIAPNDYRLRRRYMAEFALIRPDQHVAWRGDTLPDDFAALLGQVSGTPPS